MTNTRGEGEHNVLSCIILSFRSDDAMATEERQSKGTK